MTTKAAESGPLRRRRDDATEERVIRLLEELAGQKASLDPTIPEATLMLLDSGKRGIGYSQLNELLLLLGFDRVTHDFFCYFVADPDARGRPEITSITHLEECVERFRKLGLRTT